ncbi:MAG: branched-chain-amino-acid transaminase [Planctomycetota bacterium]|nr:branched-chain-amino-acid transaminase [Planctomycetota bacterium]
MTVPSTLKPAQQAAHAADSAHAPGHDPADRPFIYVNGQMLPKSKAMVSVYDHGLLYGDGIFEGIRVYKGKIFLSKQHMDRLYHCAEAIRLKIPVSPAEMVAIQRRCIEMNNLTDSYIRLVVTRGFGTLGLDPRKCPVPGIICIADTISLFPQEMYENGMRVIVANRPKTPIPCLDPRIKSLNYLNNILAKCEAIDHGCHEVIMLNTEGFVTEGSGDNIFIIKNGEVFTPTSDSGILEGCTRMFVKDRLCPMLGLKCSERKMRLEDVLSADEVFLTGTAAEIIAVTQVDQHDGKNITKVNYIGKGATPGSGTPGSGKAPPEGPITKKLRAKFREIVTSDHVPEE